MKGTDIKKIFNMHFDAYIDDKKEYDIESKSFVDDVFLHARKRFTMKLNKIQHQIYEEYKRNGKVWAECPRQAGKTELMLFIAEKELKEGNKIHFNSFSCMNLNRILNCFRKQLGKDYGKFSPNIVKDYRDADVVFFDELYYDLAVLRKNQKVVCLRTPLHKTLRFSYRDMEEEMKERIFELKQHMSKERFDVEFDNV